MIADYFIETHKLSENTKGFEIVTKNTDNRIETRGKTKTLKKLIDVILLCFDV